MSGFMLCDDLMEQVGKDVVKKREQDTLDYWIDLYFRGGNDMRASGVIQTINEIGEELIGKPIWKDNAFALIANLLEIRLRVARRRTSKSSPRHVPMTRRLSGKNRAGRPLNSTPRSSRQGGMRGDMWEEGDYDWWDEPEFWESRGIHVTKSFMGGSYWLRVIWEDEDEILRHRLREENR